MGALLAIAIFFALLIGFVSYLKPEVGAVAIVMGLLLGVLAWFMVREDIQIQKERKAEYEAKLQRYNHGWVCVRCGHTWVPSERHIAPRADRL
jgi:hypothetical protein